MTSEAAYDLKFVLLDLGNLHSHISLASRCKMLGVGTVIYLPRMLALPLEMILRSRDEIGRCVSCLLVVFRSQFIALMPADL